jgi:hypothetical protein
LGQNLPAICSLRRPATTWFMTVALARSQVLVSLCELLEGEWFGPLGAAVRSRRGSPSAPRARDHAARRCRSWALTACMRRRTRTPRV